MTLSRETRTKLVHSIKASASGEDDRQIAEIIRRYGEYHGYTPPQSWFGFPASISYNNRSSFRRSEPARVELVYEGEEDGPSEDVSGYMEVQEVVDLPTPGDQSYTHEDTSSESLLVLEENITNWLRAVPDDLERLTPSPPTPPSLPEVTNLSERQQAAVQSRLPIHPPNHQSPVITWPSILHAELQQLEKIFNASPWLLDDQLEPVIGHPICPQEAEKYGIRGASCYTAFVEQDGDGKTYGCRHENCHVHAIQFPSLDLAVRHQRYHHFDHRPFECIPLNGAQWYAILPFIL